MILTHLVLMGFFTGASGTGAAPSGGYNALFFASNTLNELLEDNIMQTLATPKIVTASDTDLNSAVLADGCNPEFLYVGITGDVALQLADKTVLVLPSVAAGGFQLMPPFTGILSTGTTATGLLVTRRV
jgi:hypothetical protein